MSDSLKVLIVAGGTTHERDVSLRSGRRVKTLLRARGHEVKFVQLNDRMLESIGEFEPDVVWPLVHGSVGEDGSLQALLETAGRAFVGTHSMQAGLAFQKPMAKGLLGSAGLATPGWLTLPRALFRELGTNQVMETIGSRLVYPVVVKPTDGGSALGISVADDEVELRAAMVDAFAYGTRVMVEQLVEGREVAVSVLDLEEGPAALPPVEVATDDGRYDYQARYTTDETEYFVPARLSDTETDAIVQAAIEAHVALGMRHLSRMDFIVDSDGVPWFLDANVMPGMTDTSLFPQAADAAGSFEEVCDRIVRFAAADTDEVAGEDAGSDEGVVATD